ncbi:MAG TPA: sigma-70 family RNA polymerase sigma factor [Jatrophihabitans sp.]|nr:sigma-70 family RNA polymerase sigma factor [Jatrophihabitans sp.]
MTEEPESTVEVAELVRAAAGGSTAAWNELVDRFSPLVWNICMRYKLSAADASDVSQNVWLRLTERLDTIREPAALAGWLATTARRECMRTFRGHHGEVPTAFDVDVPDSAERTDPDRELLALERREAVLAALGELPERGRTLLLMLAGDPPRSYREISDALDIPIGSIGPTRARYLERLRRSPALAGFGADTGYATANGGEQR